MDAFKNLIRHGKHARAPAAQPASPIVSNDPSSSTTSPSSRNRHAKHTAPDQQRTAEELFNQQKLEQFHTQPTPEAMLSPRSLASKEAAEYIVKEEREAASKMPIYPGLEGFRLLEKMGDGAFSNVYKAIDLRTGTKVAVKVVHKYELNSTQRANILKEVQIMRGIHHPSIVKLLSFSESEDHFFLILELMEGGELFHQIVKLTYFSEALSRHVILQVAQGIRYLHEERGVVHRDIKPENLLFERIPHIPSRTPVRRQYDEDKVDEGDFIPGRGGGEIGRVKIADFGLSKVVWSEETATPCGTVGYTAPEIVKDERYSKSVDMWALGCVLYTLLCGFPPFYDESINVLTEKVAKGQYTFLEPWWNDISASAKDLITHLLCVDPAERYTIDEFLAHPWCHAAPAPPPPATPAVERRTFDSPLLRPADGRSPGVTTLKEAFDVTYAVHRMEEEGARRRAYNGPGGSGARGFLHELNEEDEEEEEGGEEDESLVHYARRKRQERSVAEAAAPTAKVGVPGTRDRVQRKRVDAGTKSKIGGSANPRTFELDMGNATLLGRRHRKTVEPSPLGQPSLVAHDPGSPMRGVEAS